MRDATCEKNVLEHLLNLLRLEKIEENIFRGNSQDLGFGAIFGGQVLGQALSAASRTVTPDRRNHSFHAYFLRAGDVRLPIVYDVDCVRDGRSFSTRRVRAVQKGKVIFFMSASFQIEEQGLDHQDIMPDVPDPETLESELEASKRQSDRIPDSIKDRILCERPIEIRPVQFYNLFEPEKMQPPCHRWFRTIDKIPDDPFIHQYMLAYASDFHLAATFLHPHGVSPWQPGIQFASIDHTMWFHRPFRIDDWLLYSIDSPNAYGARGLSIGKIFTKSGLLAATVVQEGLHRMRDR